MTKVLINPPKKLKKNVGANKVPLNREPKNVRITLTITASLGPNCTITKSAAIFAKPSLAPGTGVGMGIIDSKIFRLMAMPIIKPK